MHSSPISHLSPPSTYPLQQLLPKTIETLHKKARNTPSFPDISPSPPYPRHRQPTHSSNSRYRPQKTIETLHKKARTKVSSPPRSTQPTYPFRQNRHLVVEDGWREKARLWERATSSDRPFAPPSVRTAQSAAQSASRHGRRGAEREALSWG
jgi:hypothetical protein